MLKEFKNIKDLVMETKSIAITYPSLFIFILYVIELVLTYIVISDKLTIFGWSMTEVQCLLIYILPLLVVIFSCVYLYFLYKVKEKNNYNFNKFFNSNESNIISIIFFDIGQLALFVSNLIYLIFGSLKFINILLIIYGVSMSYLLFVYPIKVEIKSNINNYKCIEKNIKQKKKIIDSCLDDFKQNIEKYKNEESNKKQCKCLIDACDGFERASMFYKELLDIQKQLKTKKNEIENIIYIMDSYSDSITSDDDSISTLSLSIKDKILKILNKNIADINNYINDNKYLKFMDYYHDLNKKKTE